MNKYARMRPIDSSDLTPNAKYLLTRKGSMKDHTGIYTFEDIFNSGEYVLYNKTLRVHYTLPLIHSDIQLYKLTRRK